jgi:hypothetical protein
MDNDDQLVDRMLSRRETFVFLSAAGAVILADYAPLAGTALAGTTADAWQCDALDVYSDAAEPCFKNKGALFHSRPLLKAEAIPPELFPLFLYYKRDRVGHESPAAVQGRLIQQFGVERARALIVLFEQTAIPARPQEWRRRMH